MLHVVTLGSTWQELAGVTMSSAPLLLSLQTANTCDRTLLHIPAEFHKVCIMAFLLRAKETPQRELKVGSPMTL